MDNFNLGFGGLQAAQKAFTIIGNNIANAATEGYHRQRIDLRPQYSSQVGDVIVGGGVEVAGVTRIIDELLVKEIFRQESLFGQVSQEFTTLRTVETAFGELTGGSGLSGAIEKFFNALQDLSAHPTETIWQNQLITEATAMTNQFRTLGDYLTSLEEQIVLEAKNTIEQINILSNRIAELNGSIEKQELKGGQANNSRDQRDQSIRELSKLVGIETNSVEFGVVDVSLAGIGTPLVVNTTTFDLEVDFKAADTLGVGVANTNTYDITTEGGRLSGLISLRNELVSTAHNDLDTLAAVMIQQINQLHVEGVGSAGSFTNLSGWPVASQNQKEG